jgi:hypothetical protein
VLGGFAQNLARNLSLICVAFQAGEVAHIPSHFPQFLQVNILKSRLPGSNSSGNSGNSNSQPEAGHNSLPAQQHQDDTLFEENEKVLQE